MEKDEIEHDVDDIFKDFEHKVTDKSETSESPTEEINEHELLKRRYQKAEHALKENYNKEREGLQKKEEEEEPKHEKTPAKSLENIERFAYIGIILVLVVYIGIDLSFYHREGAEASTEQPISVAAVKVENETNETEEVVEEEIAEEESVEEQPIEEEKGLSGIIALNTDNIYTAIIDEDNDLGEISKIVFTIDNGKDKVLTPVVDVYAYDSELDKIWETKSRGQYKGAAIKPGEKQAGSISLTPKTFKKLDLKKSIRLALNDTKDGFITAVNEQVIIS